MPPQTVKQDIRRLAQQTSLKNADILCATRAGISILETAGGQEAEDRITLSRYEKSFQAL
jgi:hypothetical protein